jgi:hypothetical protein
MVPPFPLKRESVMDRSDLPQRTPGDHTGASGYLKSIGVAQLPPLSSPFDPGYDPVTLSGHLEQSAHLISKPRRQLSAPASQLECRP